MPWGVFLGVVPCTDLIGRPVQLVTRRTMEANKNGALSCIIFQTRTLHQKENGCTTWASACVIVPFIGVAQWLSCSVPPISWAFVWPVRHVGYKKSSSKYEKQMWSHTAVPLPFLLQTLRNCETQFRSLIGAGCPVRCIYRYSLSPSNMCSTY